MDDREIPGRRSFLVDDCPRCGKEHAILVFSPIMEPDGMWDPESTWWAMCPEKGAPILLEFTLKFA